MVFSTQVHSCIIKRQKTQVNLGLTAYVSESNVTEDINISIREHLSHPPLQIQFLDTDSGQEDIMVVANVHQH